MNYRNSYGTFMGHNHVPKTKRHYGTFMRHADTVEDKDVLRSHLVIDIEEMGYEQKKGFKP